MQIIAINGDTLATPQGLAKDVFSKAKHTLIRKPPQQNILRPDSCSFMTNVNIFGQNLEMTNHIPMSLALYTSKSFIVSPESEGCSESFIPYNCSQENGCKQSEASKTFQYPFFQLEGNLTHLNASLSNKFNESSEIEVLYAQTCRKNWSQTTPQQVGGSIGFGVSSKQGFLNTESFSIYTYPEGYQAELILGLDPSKIANYSNIRLFYSNSNWEIPMQSVVTFNLGSESYSGAIAFEDKLIFDINSCYLSFPKYLFEHTLSQLAEYHHLNCTSRSGDITLPLTCTYSGDPKSLPDIVIADVAIENEIRIEPNIYLSKRKDNIFDLMIVQSVQRIGEEFASSLKYSSYVILGLPFLKEHYIYFSRGGTNRIVIYHSKSSKDDFQNLHDENSNNSYIGFIIVGVLAGLTLGAVIFSCLAQKCNKRKEETHEMGLEILEENDHKEDFLIDLNQRLTSGRVIKPSRFAQLSK